MRGGPKAMLIALAAAAMLCALSPQPPAAGAQPTWSFRVIFLPAEVYFGEWAALRVNITNTDCHAREAYLIELDGVHEDYLEAVEERAREMIHQGFIGNYSVETLRMWGKGGDVWGDHNLYLIDACAGRGVELRGAGVWFPWRGYGRGYMAWRDLSITLEAFSPVEYVLNGVSPGSSAILEFRLLIPPDIPPEEMGLEPRIDLRLQFPGWLEYTLGDYPVAENHVKPMPYRTFNLTVTGHDGLNPLPGARVVMRRLIHYYDKRVYVADEEGGIRVERLLEDSYEVTVYWNSTYYQVLPWVHLGQHSAYDLASQGVLRTRLFNLRIDALDLRGRPLRGARIFLDGVEAVAYEGSTTYPLVPEGNHSIQAYWKGVKVLDSWAWSGYHPTIYPWMTRPATHHVLKLPVDDLLVQAVDTGGNPVGAAFRVLGPTPEAGLDETYLPDGFLNLSQVPIAEYVVWASNGSDAFGVEVESEAAAKPGELTYLTLPIHSVKLTVVDKEGRPLENASVRLGPLNAPTGPGGHATFPGVPEGEYEVEVSWLGIRVYGGRIVVEEPVEQALEAEVYHVRLALQDGDGEPYMADVRLVDPAGRVFEWRLGRLIEVERVPDGLCRLEVSVKGRPLINQTIQAHSLAEEDTVTLPIGDMRVWVGWADGSPLERAEVVAVDLETLEHHSALTGGEGFAALRDLPYTRYRLTILYPYTGLPIHGGEVSFSGQEVRIGLEKATIHVRALDSLGRPVEDAEVTAYYMGVPLATAATDAEGRATLTILEAPVYKVSASAWGYRAEAAARPGEEVELRLGYLELMGLRLPEEELHSLATAAAYTVIPILLAFAAFRLLRRR